MNTQKKKKYTYVISCSVIREKVRFGWDYKLVNPCGCLHGRQGKMQLPVTTEYLVAKSEKESFLFVHVQKKKTKKTKNRNNFSKIFWQQHLKCWFFSPFNFNIILTKYWSHVNRFKKKAWTPLDKDSNLFVFVIVIHLKSMKEKMKTQVQIMLTF